MKKRLLLFLIMGIFVFDVTGCDSNSASLNQKDDISKKSYVIVDETYENELVCASALEQFYEDEDYTYSWSCIKDNYIKVKYDDGSIKLVSEALKDGDIKITDLDENNIGYYKERKEKNDIFDAEIIESKDDSIVVEVLKDSKALRMNDKIRMKIVRPTDGTNDFYVVGNKIRIEFNGFVEYSNPGQIYPINIELITE